MNPRAKTIEDYQAQLDECLRAFKAMGYAKEARHFLKKTGIKTQIWGGSGQEQLRTAMIGRLRTFLADAEQHG